MAPCTGQCSTQQPQNQHSSGYMAMGDLPFSTLGNSTSVRHTFTHVLQPVQCLGSIKIAWFGVIGLGTLYALLYISINSLKIGYRLPGLQIAMLSVILFKGCRIRRLQVIVHRVLSCLYIPVFKPQSNQFFPRRWVLGIV